jgi:hypothetical protein
LREQKLILKGSDIEVPEGVTVSVSSRKVTVKGPRGSLNKDFRHMPVDIKMTEAGNVRVERWFTSGKAAASIRTACSHISNMIIGVTKVRRRTPAQPVVAAAAAAARGSDARSGGAAQHVCAWTPGHTH